MRRRTLLKILAGSALLGGGGAGGAYAFLGQEKFGALPSGDALQRILTSPHYAAGEFQNLIPRPILSNGSSFPAALLRSFVTKKIAPVPASPVPSDPTGVKALRDAGDAVIRLGHSSFLIQLAGYRILIDPVFSPFAAPVSFSTRAFPGATPCGVRDMPDIDCLLISHDHWDHLDYPTVLGLKPKIRRVLCGLGTGAHFRRWGFADSVIQEADWGDTLSLGPHLRIHVTTASHYSGRALSRNQSLWAGFLLESPAHTIFFSGDSGYSPHFAELGRRFRRIDLALLDCGQYDEGWRFIHMTPEEAAQAADDLGARHLLPAHIGKFSLAYHPWYEPFRRITAAGENRGFRVITPIIGTLVPLQDRLPDFPRWWEGIA